MRVGAHNKHRQTNPSRIPYSPSQPPAISHHRQLKEISPRFRGNGEWHLSTNKQTRIMPHLYQQPPFGMEYCRRLFSFSEDRYSSIGYCTKRPIICTLGSSGSKSQGKGFLAFDQHHIMRAPTRSLCQVWRLPYSSQAVREELTRCFSRNQHPTSLRICPRSPSHLRVGEGEQETNYCRHSLRATYLSE